VNRDYRNGLLLSALVHVGVVVAAVTGLPALTRPPPEQAEVIPVEFVTIAERARTTEPAPPAPEPEPESEPVPQLAPAETPPQIAAEVPPPPEDKPAPPEPEPAPEPEPEPEPEAESTPRLQVMPRAKPSPPTRFDPSRLAALIDRSIEEETPQPDAREESDEPPPETEETPEERRQQAALADRFAAVTLKALIRDRVQKCWYLPAGAKDVADMQVTIRIDLRRDGRLARAPRFVDTGRHSLSDDQFYRIFAESARRAVQNCEPYEDLPPAQYHIWQSIEFTFDAGRMLGG